MHGYCCGVPPESHGCPEPDRGAGSAPVVPPCKSLSVTKPKSIKAWVLRWDWPAPAPGDQISWCTGCQLVPASKDEQGLGGPACGIMYRRCGMRHWQGSDICSLLCLAAREARRYLHLPPLRAHGRETHCLHPGGQEPEEDGCWGSLRWVLARGHSPAAPVCVSQHPLLGKDTGAFSLAELEKAPSSVWDLPHWRQPKVWLGVRGDGDGMSPLTFRRDIFNLVCYCVRGQNAAGPGW